MQFFRLVVGHDIFEDIALDGGNPARPPTTCSLGLSRLTEDRDGIRTS